MTQAISSERKKILINTQDLPYIKKYKKYEDIIALKGVHSLYLS